MEMLFAILASLVAIYWLRILVDILRAQKLQITVSNIQALQDLPLVSIIIPIRNDARRLKKAVLSLLHQTGAKLELILVDDRSTDDSPQVLENLRKKDSRIRVLRIEKLPDGWLGKCHAMQRGAQIANGEFLLFTDADVIFKPETLQKTVSLLVREKGDHLAVSSKFEVKNFFEEIFFSSFKFFFFTGAKIWRVNAPRSKTGYGNGVFNLIRKSAFHRIGGMELLKLEVIEDVGIGKLVRHFGLKQFFAFGHESISVRYQEGVIGLITGLEKNAFSRMRFSLGRTIFKVCFLNFMTFVPFIAIFDWKNKFVFVPGVLGLLFLFGIHRLVCRSGKWWAFFFLPLGAVHLSIALLWSAFICLKRGGVIWRETFYPLAILREGHLERVLQNHAASAANSASSAA